MIKPSILLNGASSAGKSSVARAIIDAEATFSHLELDDFLKQEGQKGHNLGEEWPHLRKVFIRYAAITIASNQPLIIDTVCTPHSTPYNLFDKLREHNEVFIVGLRPPVEVLYKRGKEREDRMLPLGVVLQQEMQAHRDILYDYEVDNANLTPTETALRIMQAYKEKYHL